MDKVNTARKSLAIMKEIACGLKVPVYIIAFTSPVCRQVLIDTTMETMESLYEKFEEMMASEPTQVFSVPGRTGITYASMAETYNAGCYKFSVFSADHHLNWILSAIGAFNNPKGTEVNLRSALVRELIDDEKDETKIFSSNPVYMIELECMAPGVFMLLLENIFGQHVMTIPIESGKKVLSAIIRRPEGKTIVLRASRQP